MRRAGGITNHRSRCFDSSARSCSTRRPIVRFARHVRRPCRCPCSSFDARRHLVPRVPRGRPVASLGDFLFQFDFGVLGVEVCEDIWSADGPMRRRAYSGAEIICNLSSSPFRIGVEGTRREYGVDACGRSSVHHRVRGSGGRAGRAHLRRWRLRESERPHWRGHASRDRPIGLRAA